MNPACDLGNRVHIRAEIAAAFRASGRKRLVVAPAFPAAGRITQEGRQYVHGVPVDQSSYAAHPAQTAQIADLIDPDFGMSALLRQPGEDPGKARVVILDATRQAHLNAHIRALGDPVAGALGRLARACAGLAALLPETTEAVAMDVRVRCLLIMAESANPGTHLQCDKLADAGVPIVTDPVAARHGLTAALCLAVPGARLAQPPLSRLADQAATALSQGRFDGPETLFHAITALQGGKEPDHA